MTVSLCARHESQQFVARRRNDWLKHREINTACPQDDVPAPDALDFCAFFFSSRRRHTRYIGDWSSDVCSSDLLASDRRFVEVIVAANFTEPSVAGEFPFARLLLVGEDATVPMLRSAGMREARGEIVATVEDHMRFDTAWCREIRRAHELAHAAIGGSVDNSAGQSLVDWAMYL